MLVAKAVQADKVSVQANLTHSVRAQGAPTVELVAVEYPTKITNKLNVITWLPALTFILVKLDMKALVEEVE